MPTIELRKCLTDGVYTIEESENPNVLFFYRNDDEVLTDLDKSHIREFYQGYQAINIFEGNSTEREPFFLQYDLSLYESVDGKIMKIINNPLSSKLSSENLKKKGFFAKLKEFFK